MKKMIVLMLIVSCLVISGCCTTTAGPFVTNISSDGKGGLNVEKAKVKFNCLTDELETCETTNSTIQVNNPVN